MNRILVSVLLLLSSCVGIKDANTRVTYVNATSSEMTSEGSRGFDRVPGAEVGVTYGGEGEEDRAVGFLSDIAIQAQDLEDSAWQGDNITLRSLGLKTGLRYYVDTGSARFQPYLGAALLGQYTWLSTDAPGDGGSVTSVGAVGSVGIESQLSRHMRLNLGYSITGMTDPEIDGVRTDLDSSAFFLGLGWSF